MDIVQLLIKTGIIGFVCYFIGAILVEGAGTREQLRLPVTRRQIYLLRSISFLEYWAVMGALAIIIYLHSREQPHYWQNTLILLIVIAIRALIQFDPINKFMYKHIISTRLEYMASLIILGGAFYAAFLHFKNLTNTPQFIVYYSVIYTFIIALRLKAAWADRKFKIHAAIYYKNGREEKDLELLDETTSSYIFANGKTSNRVVSKDSINEMKTTFVLDEQGYESDKKIKNNKKDA